MKINFEKSLQKVFLFIICFLFTCTSCTANEKKEITASEIIKLIKKEKHIHIAEKIIIDDLNFTDVNQEFIVNGSMLQNEINSNILFVNCVFMGKVSTKSKKANLPVNSVFKNNLAFLDCDFRGDIDFSNTIVFGMLNFSQSKFREKAIFDNLSIWAKDSYFNEIKVEKTFSMIYASFHGNLYMTNSEFKGKFTMQETYVNGKLSLNNCIFFENANFDLISINKNAFFNYVTFNKTSNFSFSYFMQSTEFINTTFNEKGLFEKTFFNDSVRFENIDINNDIIIENTYFNNQKIK
ncbi:MAG: hypothetical protein LBP67_05300 [Bacteroidales bacterium]|jgi:hypothetical protein|nr:hypothetical protein [Bacteroidales bacterium]